ncbi:MAG: hypothetical protein PHD43_11350, partial [Methylococcales bacterium]|nr:hypothetical protein [Methylococcales bacterium]
PTKSEKIFSYNKVCLPTTTGLVQQPVQIVARYRSHNLTLFVRLRKKGAKQSQRENVSVITMTPVEFCVRENLQ